MEEEKKYSKFLEKYKTEISKEVDVDVDGQDAPYEVKKSTRTGDGVKKAKENR